MPEQSPKIALITGGSRGLGRNTAVHLARSGVDVVLTYHSNKAEADAAVAEIADLGRKASATARHGRYVWLRSIRNRPSRNA